MPYSGVAVQLARLGGSRPSRVGSRRIKPPDQIHKRTSFLGMLLGRSVLKDVSYNHRSVLVVRGPEPGQIRKSSFFAFPPLVAAVIQRGMRPRPVQVFPIAGVAVFDRDGALSLPAAVKQVTEVEAVSLAMSAIFCFSAARSAPCFSIFARSIRACIAASSATDIFSMFLLRAMFMVPIEENVYPPPISIASVYK